MSIEKLPCINLIKSIAMTTVSDTDIKELKQFISDGLNSLKLEWKEDINQLDKRITEKLSDLKQE